MFINYSILFFSSFIINNTQYVIHKQPEKRIAKTGEKVDFIHKLWIKQLTK